MSKEFIACSANHYDDGQQHVHQPTNIKKGFITCGLRHNNCINTFAAIVGFPYSEDARKIKNTEVQGFLTSHNRFVDRKEAFEIAYNANQVTGEKWNTTPELHSEDLFYK